MFKHNFFIHDYENQNHPWYGSVASPHCPDNYIVATGYCIDGGDIQAHYFNSDEEAKSHNWIDKLQDYKMYVAHNATFEIQWMMRTYPKQFLDWIKKGGKVFCTQYAEYILTHQIEMYPKLEDCAIKYGGSKKIDEVKLLWEQGVLTADIDKALLMKYLADPKLGDVANTRRVCFSQVALLRKNGMWDMFMERMNSLLFNAIASYHGLYVDMEVAKRNQQAQEIEIETIKASILDMLPADLPNDFEFSFTSAYHLSAFLFGGTIQYKAKVSYDPIKYVKKDCYQFGDTYVPVVEDESILSEYEMTYGEGLRFQRGKNAGQLKVVKVETDEELLKWGDKQYRFKGLLDFDTLPKIVSEAYVGKRAEFRGKRELVDGTPIYSTGKDSLDVLAAHTDVAKPLKNLAALIKDTTTYYLVVDDKGKESGMLQFVEPNGIIHHQLNNCATITGRLSGSKPNMQNIPRDGTSKVKEMFSSRFGVNGRIVEVDYSALEVVALASISGDKNLMRMLIEGIDMHCYRLAAKLGEDYESVFEKCHNKEHPEHKQYKQWRTDIKPRAFAHQYGASAEGIAFSTGCTLEDAQEFKNIEFELFPESNAFPAKFVRPMVEETGNAAQPIREFDEETGRYNVYRRGYFQAKSGTCYSFRQFDKWDKELKQTVKDYKDTQIANYWCQGEASFIVQAACGRVIRELIKRNFADGLVLPINTVHDAIYLDCATEALAKEYGALVRDIMEATPKYLAEVIPALKDWNYHLTPFPAAAECGVNMMNKEDI
jgi:DNA polymerase I-like protein with 3'-5' exonuclease and polymerase domains